MGNDGGTIARRSDILSLHSKTKESSFKDVLDDSRGALLNTCAISSQPLSGNGPIVSDYKGRLYLKEAILEYIVSRNKAQDTESQAPETGENALAHVRTTSDLVQLTVFWEKTTDTRLKCPISQDLKQTTVFVYLRGCGCVLLSKTVQTAEKESQKCPGCDKPFSSVDIVKLNPTNDEMTAAFNTANYHKVQALGLTHSKKKKKRLKRRAPEPEPPAGSTSKKIKK